MSLGRGCPMPREILARGFFYWLRAPRDYSDFSREQWIMAIARLFMSLCFLANSAHSHGLSSTLPTTLLCLYSIYSVLITFALRFRIQSSPAFHIGLHCADVLWAAQLALVIEWPGVSLVLLFFLLISSKMRWGFWEALLTGGGFSFLWLAGSLIYSPVLGWRHASPLDALLEFAIHMTMSLVIGRLAEPKLMHMEKSRLTTILEGIDSSRGLTPAMQTICSAAMSLFRATQILIAIHDRHTDRTLLFRAGNTSENVQCEVLTPEQYSHYFFTPPATGWRMRAVRRARTPEFRCLTLQDDRLRTCRGDCGMPETFLAEHPLHLVLSVDLPVENEICIRPFVIDPHPWFGGAAALRFLWRGALQVAPVIRSLFLLDRIKSKAEAEVHHRLARELHDGAIQSLTSISLQLDQLWRCAGPALTAEALRLASIQKNIRDEIASLREFATELRSLDIDAARLIPHLSQLAVKFQFDSDIAARFACDVEEVRLRPSVCVEIARIAQEALANVRKHSGAGEVLIRFNRRNGNYLLAITDNGCGFKFSGRRSHEDLRAAGEGPVVILERAKEIQARVEIESIPGSGSSLEVSVPVER